VVAEKLEPLVAAGAIARPGQRGNMGKGMIEQRRIGEVIADRLLEQRRAAAKIYDELLKPLAESVVRPVESSFAKSVYHLYVVRTKLRDDLQKFLTDAGVGTGIHYPIPIHLQVAYASRGWKRGDFPNTEAAANEILSLPMFAGLTLEQQNQVVDHVSQFAASLAVS